MRHLKMLVAALVGSAATLAAQPVIMPLVAATPTPCAPVATATATPEPQFGMGRPGLAANVIITPLDIEARAAYRKAAAPGTVLIAIKFKIETTIKNDNRSALFYGRLVDADGNAFDEIDFGKTPEMPAFIELDSTYGNPKVGWLTFEVPPNAKKTKIEYRMLIKGTVYRFIWAS